MYRIIVSLALIVVTGGALTFGATRAFFSDTETATANVMTAGAIDLKIGNDSYYNGAENGPTSWEATDLTVEKFFDFDDLKPGDYGEDTISLTVETNDAYLCADFTLTAHADNSQTEPEALEDANGLAEAELAPLVNFLWWADDGDNVLEDDEKVITGPAPVGLLPLNQTYPLTLADSDQNIWTGQGGPVVGNDTYHIGKAWCFGTMGVAPLEQDESGSLRSPADNNDGVGAAGTPEDGGYTCDGSQLGNESQTDSLTADVSFRAVQARNNPGFQCAMPNRTRLTLVKNVLPSGPFNDPATAWTLSADGPGTNSDISGVTGAVSVTNASVTPGTYNLSEAGPTAYTGSQWSCTGGTQVDGDTVTIAEGQNVVCTITNYVACTPTERFADSVVDSNQGERKNGTAVTPDRINPAFALGAPQSSGASFDNPVVASSFFSLGFDEIPAEDSTPTEGGWIVLEFTDNYIVDGPGNDIRAWEVTGGTSYPVEKIKIEVSQNGSAWYVLESSADRDAEADLADVGLSWAQYVRITDVSVRSEFEDTADGYDLDAVSALTCGSRQPVQSDLR
jgi:hypothetical protein